MAQEVLCLLHRELRKCFQSLKTSRSVWNSVIEECRTLVSSLGNLAEQLSAVKRVELSNTPLSSFPQLQHRIQTKLLHVADTALEQLREKMLVLQSIQDLLSKQLLAAHQFYEQNSDSLPVDVCVARSALSPSIADMLEWLQDAERHYRMQCIQRRNLIESLKPDNLTLMETVSRRWTSIESPQVEERITDALLKAAFFMDSD